uniref:Uncharacterized protein n=1 Tax=Human betaherpesvirus 6 TaxID=10368 RepID=A0A5P9S618_9BETA|nr:hypothetical protein [Human betaherpesvirus 6]
MKKKNIFNLLTFYTMKVSKPHFLNVTLLVFFFQRQRSIVLSVFHQTLESINLKYQIHL